ncbi:MAG: (2Fe-2S) ferredoxin domain-containing protein [Gammaproteobacteria bacterium]|nr:(2Fe-2S) ferredoxin domain-containing protein [Gammaproteobacteria bacterium]
MSDSYYKYHVFFCTNQRDDGSQSCGDCNAGQLRDYAKKAVKAAGLNKPGGVRINTAGCLDRCSEGPAIVIYPQAVWYTYVDQEDIDEIIESHLKKGGIVERLKLPD